MDSAFKDKTLLITGGTGSFGHTVLNHFLLEDSGEIRIFSRYEKKQDDMRHMLQSKYPDSANKVQFYIGDVRDERSVAAVSYTHLDVYKRQGVKGQSNPEISRSPRNSFRASLDRSVPEVEHWIF